MGRKQERKRAEEEKNALAELCKIQRKFIPDLFELFERTSDPRNQCYVTYPNRLMLGQMYFKGIAGIVSMQDMTHGGKLEVTEFQWITSLEVTKENAGRMAGNGRLRWKIENEGFNRQKNWDGDITHACSHNANALKNHYLMRQISDFIKQLYEWFYLKKKGIKRAIKNISPVFIHKNFEGASMRDKGVDSLPKWQAECE